MSGESVLGASAPATLLDILANHCPDLSIEIFAAGHGQVFGFHRGAKTLWVALDRSAANPAPATEDLAPALQRLANMLAFCQNCSNNLRDYLCRCPQHLTARRLRRFLGDTAFEAFLAHATTRSPSPVFQRHRLPIVSPPAGRAV